MTRVLVVGKRGGILQWYEHVLAVDGQRPDVHVSGFAINHNNAWEQLSNRLFYGKGSDRLASVIGRRLADCIRQQRPDLILVVDLFYFHYLPILNDVLGAAGMPVVQWVGDRFDEKLKENTAIQRFYFTDSSFIPQAEAMGLVADYLPLAVNPAVFRGGRPWAERDPTLLFVGAWSANRQALLEQLPVPVKIYGKGWERLQSPLAEVHPRNVRLSQVAALYGRHQKVLNIINSDNVAAGLNMRCFEATAAGACLITDWVADLERCFVVGEEVAAYASVAQFGECMSVLAGGGAARLAGRGENRTRHDHSYASRITWIVENAFGANAC